MSLRLLQLEIYKACVINFHAGPIFKLSSIACENLILSDYFYLL